MNYNKYFDLYAKGKEYYEVTARNNLESNLIESLTNLGREKDRLVALSNGFISAKENGFPLLRGNDGARTYLDFVFTDPLGGCLYFNVDHMSIRKTMYVRKDPIIRELDLYNDGIVSFYKNPSSFTHDGVYFDLNNLTTNADMRDVMSQLSDDDILTYTAMSNLIIDQLPEFERKFEEYIKSVFESGMSSYLDNYHKEIDSLEDKLTMFNYEYGDISDAPKLPAGYDIIDEYVNAIDNFSLDYDDVGQLESIDDEHDYLDSFGTSEQDLDADNSEDFAPVYSTYDDQSMF